MHNRLFLRNYSIKHRLLIAFLITSIFPVVMVALYSNIRYEQSVSDKLSAFSLQVLSESALNATRELQQYETLSESIIINRSIQNGLYHAREMSDFEKNALQNEISNQLGEQVFRLSNLSNVIVLSADGSSFYDMGYEWYPGNQIPDVLKDIERTAGNTRWSYLSSNREANKIALARVIFSENNLNQIIGYLVIVIDEKVFSRNTYEHVDLGEGGRLYIVDGNTGKTVSSASSSIAEGQMYEWESVFLPIREGKGSPAFYAEIDGRRELVASTYIRSANWYMIGLIPHAYVVSELVAMREDIIYISLLFVIFSAVVSMLIYRSISNPMRDLLQYASQIRMGQLDTRIATVYPDEMGRLSETIDQMVLRLKELIVQVESEQKEKREAELKMLQAQINPHFLFNTLNSLKWSAMMSGNTVVEQGLTSLSELLHNTILTQDELIPLEKEIDNVLHYSVIQRLRYGDSFKLFCEVEEDRLYQCLVPRFILQPIVENSIIHAGGGEGRVVGIKLEVSAQGEMLLLRVVDNGKGFDMEKIRRRRHSHDKLSGIGIGNVEERIRLHVDSPYGMTTWSRPEQGTETVIKLPIKWKEYRADA